MTQAAKETKAQRVERLKREKNPLESLEEIRKFAREGHASIQLRDSTGSRTSAWKARRSKSMAGCRMPTTLALEGRSANISPSRGRPGTAARQAMSRMPSVESGLDPQTPCVIVACAARKSQQMRWTHIAGLGRLSGIDAPALLIVGQVTRPAAESITADIWKQMQANTLQDEQQIT